ncbi:MAG: hypothetical protein HFH49_15700 [Lachnospiraceae bacterium]|nr:hypothetical protein [Lachnospiraceae bacterium]
MLSRKLSLFTGFESISLPLEERVLNHMKYYCQNGVLSGIEKTACRLLQKYYFFIGIRIYKENSGKVCRNSGQPPP